MNTKKIKPARMVLAAILIIFTAASLLLAQDAYARRNGKNKSGDKEKLQRRIEQMIVWELSEVMDLDEDKEEKFIDVLRKHFKDKSKITTEQFDLMKQLRQLYKDKNATDAQIKAVLDKLETNYVDQMKLQKSLVDNLKRVLTVREQARFAVEWPNIQSKIMTKLRNKKQGNRQ